METPVMPEPIMQISASAVRGPELPTRASGFTSGAPCVQKERVELGTGNDSDADSRSGEKVAWNWSCNGSCKATGDKAAAAKLCTPTRLIASKWWMRKRAIIIEVACGHGSEDMRPRNTARYRLFTRKTDMFPLKGSRHRVSPGGLDTAV
jgi:hypothetical protein